MPRKAICRKALTICIVVTGALAALRGQGTDAVVLKIQADQVAAHVRPMFYGLMTEEINYSYDGGLYAELVRNRTFFSDRHGVPSWRLIERGQSLAAIALDKTTAPSEALPYSMKLTVEKATESDQGGISNQGYWGMPVR